jgi:hypothetical protein
LLPYTYNNADNIFFSAVAYGAITLDAASVIDSDDIYATNVIPNARSEIGFVEDDDIFYDPDVSTIWIVFNTHVDSDDFTNDTEIHNVNYIRHVGGFSIEEIIPPSTLHMSHAVSAVFIADDDIFGVDTLSQVEFDPSRVMSPDSFFVITLFTDFIFTTPPVPSDDVFYIPAITAVTGSVQNITPGRYVDTLESIRQPSIGKGPVYMSPSHVAADTTIFAADTSSIQLRPILVTDNDIIFAASTAKGAVTLQPTKYADTDNILTPMISQDPQHSELYDDTDLFIPPYMARLRGVRTGVGVIRGRVDNVNYLTGNRDAP